MILLKIGIGISAPIMNYICPAALSILGPENSLKSKVKVLIKELKACAMVTYMPLSKSFSDAHHWLVLWDVSQPVA